MISIGAGIVAIIVAAWLLFVASRQATMPIARGPSTRMERHEYNACLDRWAAHTRRCLESCRREDFAPSFCATACNNKRMIARTCFPPPGVRLGERAN